MNSAAVSHQIKTLEDILGLSLFRRRGRAVQSTDAAKRYALRVAQAFDTIEAAIMDLQANPMSGTLRIAVTPFYSNRIVLPRLSQFHAMYPDIRVEPEMSATHINFCNTGLDGGLLHGTGNWPGLTSVVMQDDHLAPVAAPTVVADRDLPLSARDIAKLTLGYTEGQKDDWVKWLGVMGYDGAPPERMIGYGSRTRVVDLAFSGHGVALADKRLTEADVAAGYLVRLNETSISTGRGIQLAYPDTESPDPRLLAFGDWFREEVAQI